MKTFVDNSKNVKTLCNAKDVKVDIPEAMYHLAFIEKTRILLCNGLEGI